MDIIYCCEAEMLKREKDKLLNEKFTSNKYSEKEKNLREIILGDIYILEIIISLFKKNVCLIKYNLLKYL